MLKYKVVTVKEVLDNVIKHLVSDLLLIIHHDITNSVWESVRNLWLGDNSIWLSWNIRNTTVHVKLLSLIPHLEFTGQLQLRHVELLSRQLPGLPDPVRWLLLAQQGRRRAGDVTTVHTQDKILDRKSSEENWMLTENVVLVTRRCCHYWMLPWYSGGWHESLQNRRRSQVCNMVLWHLRVWGSCFGHVIPYIVERQKLSEQIKPTIYTENLYIKRKSYFLVSYLQYFGFISLMLSNFNLFVRVLQLKFDPFNDLISS